MSLDLLVEVKSEYVLFTLSGEFDLASAMELVLRCVDAHREHRLPKGVLDVRSVTGRMSTIDRYDLGVFVADLHLEHTIQEGQQLRLACVGSDNLIDPNRLGEIVAVNRGARVKATTDMEEGLSWLGVAPDPRQRKEPERG